MSQTGAVGRINRRQEVKPLPNNPRSDLHLAVCLQTYAHLSKGDSKKLSLQYQALYNFYHSVPPNHPSHMKIICSTEYIYKGMYNEVNDVITEAMALGNNFKARNLFILK